MSSKTANRLKTAVVVLLVSLISAVFALQFGGPQAEGCSSQGARYAAKVYGKVITEGDFLASERLVGFQNYPEAVARQLRLKEVVLDGLIERNLLARQATKVGLYADADNVMGRLASSASVYVSLGVDSPFGIVARQVPVPVQDEKGRFDKESAKRFVQYGLRRSIGEFAEAQVEETLAQQLRALLAASAAAGPLELWQAFADEQDRVSLSYVRFSPAYFRELQSISPEALSAWTAKHRDLVAKESKAQQHRYAESEKAKTTPSDTAPGTAAANPAAPPDARSPDAPSIEQRVATDLFRDELAKAAASRAASQALAALRAGKTLDQVAEEAVASTKPPSPTGPADDATKAEDESAWEPKVQTTELFGRGDNPLASADNTTELVRAAFRLSESKRLPERAVAVGEDRFVIELKERKKPDPKQFRHDLSRLRRERSAARALEVVQAAVRYWHKQAMDDKAIVRNSEVLAYQNVATQE